MKERIILVTNDDGVHAPGLIELTRIMGDYGKVVVVAPQEAMSGMSHAVTVRDPLRLMKIEEEGDHLLYSCTGTPADAVKMGIQVVLRRLPDLVVSGINHGSNANINILYSGTMAAVLEGTLAGIPSIGFSLMDYSRHADFSACDEYIRSVVTNVIREGLPAGACLNVNIPAISKDEIKGIKVCKQGRGMWVEEFDARKDPHNRDYYWLTGVFRSFENGSDTDDWALRNGFVSVVPVHYDLTAHQTIDTIKKWKWNAE